MGRRIFIHHSGALGDLLVSLAAIEALREPGDSIHLAGRGDVVRFLEGIGYISGGTRSDSAMYLPLFSGEPDVGLSKFLAGFDGIYVFSANPHSMAAENICKIRPDTKVVMTLPPPEAGIHVSDFRLRQVAQGMEDAFPAFKLALPSALREEARVLLINAGYDFKRPLVAIHPGSGSKKKCWPLTNCKKLMENLRERYNCFLLVVSGPAEAGSLQKGAGYLEGYDNSSIHICGYDLSTVACLLSFCGLYIGNDSGITHLASSVMTGRIVAVFGPTDPVLWRPRAEGAAVVSSDMECAPCETKRPGGRFSLGTEECGVKCLADIPVEKVTVQCRPLFFLFREFAQ